MEFTDKEISNYEKDKKFYFLRFLEMGILTLWVGLKKIVLGSTIRTNTFWFDGVSVVCRRIKENAFSWRALDIIYNIPHLENSTFENRITNFWNKSLNAQAARNRLKLTKRLLEKAIRETAEKDKEVRILSIASGSAQGVIEVIARVEKELGEEGVKIKAMLLDREESAIAHSRRLAQESGIIEGITFLQESTHFLEELTRDFRPQIVEMVGFLEYRPYNKAIKLLEKIHRVMSWEGILLVSQIAPNPERFFLQVVANWPMIYRNSSEFSDIISKGGFLPKDCQISYEPLKIHGVGICKKSS